MFVLSQSDIRGGIFPIYATLAAAKEQDSWEIAFPFHFSLVWCQNGKHFEIHTSVFSTTSRIYSRSFSNNEARWNWWHFREPFFFLSRGSCRLEMIYCTRPWSVTVRSGKIVRYYVVFLTLNEGVCIHKTPGMKKACKTSGLNRWQQGNSQVHRGKSRGRSTSGELVWGCFGIHLG